LPVVYVTGDVAGGAESPAYAIFHMNKAIAALGQEVAIYNSTQPPNDARPAIKWDGEWDITLELFRDLGSACAVVLLLIYALLVGWFRSFTTPLVVMAPIPFSLVGILPAHAALGAFFTATSLIGFMAGAGIVVRNSIILVDFVDGRIRQGMPVEQAVVEAGAVRFRPMLLTALAVTVGSAMILFDPIFQGLALSLAAGELASLLISRMAVPVLYAMAHRRTRPAVEVSMQAGLAQPRQPDARTRNPVARSFRFRHGGLTLVLLSWSQRHPQLQVFLRPARRTSRRPSE
jgi:multidrug efflux pump subunit AcrB